MKKVRRTILGALVPAALVAVALAGCSGTSSAAPTSSVNPKAPVTISLSNQPPATQAADLATYKKLIADFEKAYPNVTVKGTETAWDPSTFQALIAGKQMPTVMAVPFTEPQGLIARKQVSDITAELAEVGLKDKLNPSLLPIMSDKAGHIYGVPADSYALGLAYNRDLFEKAGLDPDKPPTTWEQVRKDAKIIADKTGVAGYGQMTTGGQGGWTLTAMTYSAGGTVENAAGTKVTFTDTKAMQQQLQLLHDMRWDDDSMGSNFVYDQNSLLQAFAAGKVGMVIGAPISYYFTTALFGMDGSIFGLGSLPQGAKAGGSLSGGGGFVVAPNATPAQRLAAAELLNFRLRGLTDKSEAITEAKATAAAKQPVGLPGLSPIKGSIQKQYLGWVKDYVNVPVEHFAPYTATVDKIKLTTEPAKNAQEVYATLDPVVQAVLTKKDADIPSLLASAKSTIESQLTR